MKKHLLIIFILLFSFPSAQGMYLLQRSVRAIQDYLKKATDKSVQAEKIKKEQQEALAKQSAEIEVVEDEIPPLISGAGLAAIDEGSVPEIEKSPTAVFEGIEESSIQEGGLGDAAAKTGQSTKDKPSTSGYDYSQEKRVTPQTKKVKSAELPSLNPDGDYYLTLGVDKNASEKEITKAYRARMLFYRDRDNDVRVLNTAYKVLSNPEARQVYDSVGLQGVQQYQELQNFRSNITGNLDAIFQQLEEKKSLGDFQRLLSDLVKEMDVSLPGNLYQSMEQLFYQNQFEELKIYAERFKRLILPLVDQFPQNATIMQAFQFAEKFNFMATNPQAYLQFIEQQRMVAQFAFQQQQLFRQYKEQFTQQIIGQFRGWIEQIILRTENSILLKDFFERSQDHVLLDTAINIAQNIPDLFFFVMRLYAIKASAYFEHFQWVELATVLKAAEQAYENISDLALRYGYRLNDASTKRALKELNSYRPLLNKVEEIIKFNKKLTSYIELKDPEELKEKVTKVIKERFSIPQWFAIKKVKTPNTFKMLYLAIPVVNLLDLLQFKLLNSSEKLESEEALEYKENAVELLELARAIAREVNEIDLEKKLKQKINKINEELYS